MKKLIKLKSKISYGKHYIDKNDNTSVVKSLNSGVLSGGKNIIFFEKKIKEYLKSKYALACSSGTAALHLAFLSLNLKKNDVVILPVINFVAAANILSLMNINFFFADVDKETGQITEKTFKECLKKNNIKKVKVLLTSYMGGNIYNYQHIINLKNKYGFLLLEDACHALGSQYKIKNKYYKIGSCKHADIATFSFHPLKTITTGEGGLVTTNKNHIYKKIKLLRSHGFNYQKKYWNYNLEFSGLNYRMSDINAALGFSQLKKIAFFLKKRYSIAYRYNKGLKNLKYVSLPELQKYSSWHLYIIKIDFKKIKISRNYLIKKLNSINIFPQIHYTPNTNFKKFNKLNKYQFKNAKKYYESCLSLPIYFKYSKKNQEIVIKNLINILS